MDISVGLQLRQTDYAWIKLTRKQYANECGVSKSDIKDTIENGDVPACSEGSNSLQEADAARFLNEFNQRADDHKHVLVGYQEVHGQKVGAHDVLARVTSVDVSNVEGSDCTEGVESGGIRFPLFPFFGIPETPRIGEGIDGSLEKALNRNLPLSIRNALQDLLSIDPALIGGGTFDLPCNPDGNTCGWEPGPPAEFSAPFFQSIISEGGWQGARHDCRPRDKDRLADLISNDAAQDEIKRVITRAASDDQNGDGNSNDNDTEGDPICHFQVEPDRLNVRPDGIEIVFVDNLTQDPQGSVFQREDATVRFLCGQIAPNQLNVDVRQSAAPGANKTPEQAKDVTPEYLTDDAPFTVNDVTSDDSG